MEWITALKDTPVPTVLTVAGVVFILLALGAQIGGQLNLPRNNQRKAAVTGVVLLILGIGLSTIPSRSTLSATNRSISSPTNSSNNISPDDLYKLARSWKTIVFDDFNQTGANWLLHGKGITTTFDSELRITVNTKETSINTNLVHKTAQAQDDFLLSVDAQAANQTGCYYGFVFRINPNLEQYRFELHKENDTNYTYKVTRFTKDAANQYQSATLIGKSDIPEGIGLPNSLQIIGQSDRYLFFVNGVYIDTIVDNEILNGKSFGIYQFTCPNISSNLVFDNFTLKAP